MSRIDPIEAFGLPLYRSTIDFLARRGVRNWEALCSLNDRERSLIPGWGRVTEAKFLKRRDALVR
ncbi:hypothetical protein KZ813_00140 [Sphingomonas sp. RHCKR7]|uniref:hypothetical protein n=1 Tax=Sphingomonas folli TaxID=2862497 RepID=UPI001CA58681|nr:hypothetical protein [Sphingomonas folli]MBW6525244.1 hypothetical protein [Sphingomonas folli]